MFCTNEIQQNLCVEGRMERIRRNGRRMDRRGLRKYCKKGMSESIRGKSWKNISSGDMAKKWTVKF